MWYFSRVALSHEQLKRFTTKLVRLSSPWRKWILETMLNQVSNYFVLVTPVLTYAIEIWGPSLLGKNEISRDHSLKCLLDSPCCENLNVKLCKYVLGIGRKSCNDAARGELGRHPILLLTMHRWINYMKHCFSLPLQHFAHSSLTPADNNKVDSTNWSSKMKNVIISSFQGNDVEFSPNALFHPAGARIVHDH